MNLKITRTVYRNENQMNFEAEKRDGLISKQSCLTARYWSCFVTFYQEQQFIN